MNQITLGVFIGLIFSLFIGLFLSEMKFSMLHFLLFKRNKIDINKLNFNQREHIYKRLLEIKQTRIRIFKKDYKMNYNVIYELNEYGSIDKQIKEDNLMRLLILEVLCMPLENCNIDSFLKEQEKMKILRKELSLD